MDLIKSAFRTLYKLKLYSSINLLGLILGLTCSFAIFLYASFEFSFDKFHEDKESIFRINIISTNPENKGISPMVRIPVGPDIKDEFSEIEDFVRMTNRGQKKQISFGENEIASHILYADKNFFKFFSFKLSQGNPDNVLEDGNSIVLSERIAESLFGETNPIGQIVICDNNPYMVSGIAENAPLNSHIQFNVVFPLDPLINSPDVFISWSGGMSASTFIKLHEHSSRLNIERQLPDFLWEKINKDAAKGFQTEFYLEPIEKIHLFSNVDWDMFDKKDAKNLSGLLFIGCFVFIIALINYLFISNATLSLRLKDFNIKRFLGNGRYGPIKQIFIESLLLFFGSGIASVILLVLFKPSLYQLFGSDFIQMQLYKSLPLLFIFIIATCILISLIQYIYNYKNITNTSLSFPKESRLKNRRLAYISAFQFCISITLISSVLIVYKQLNFSLNKDLGFTKQNIINISHNSIGDKGQTLIKEFKRIPGVVNASASFGLPGLETTSNGYRHKGTDQWHMFNAIHIDDNFFNTYHLQLIEGRHFREGQNIDSESFIINETLAKQLNWENPIGEYLFRNGNHEIVGVVKDFHVSSMYYKIPPLIISKEWHERFYTLSISLRNEDLPGTLKQIENKWMEINPNVPFRYSFFDSLFGKLYTEIQRTGMLLIIFTSISILIAVLGLFGITFLLLNSKVKEIGIRKINGARISEVMSMLNKNFIKWVAISFLISTPIAYYTMQKWLEKFAYKTELNWWIFALAGALVMGIALLTVSWQSWRAASRNPVEALRYE